MTRLRVLVATLDGKPDNPKPSSPTRHQHTPSGGRVGDFARTLGYFGGDGGDWWETVVELC
jgi:hypothetical protein